MEIRLTPLNVPVTELLKRLGIRGASGGFDLSHAVVPVVDLTRLLGIEPGGDQAQVVERVFEIIGAGIHAPTVRATYTLTAFERGELRSAAVFLQRTAAGGAANTAQAFIRITRAGGNISYPVMARVAANNTVGANNGAGLGTRVDLYRGDTVDAVTADDSTTTSAFTYFGFFNLGIVPTGG